MIASRYILVFGIAALMTASGVGAALFTQSAPATQAPPVAATPAAAAPPLSTPLVPSVPIALNSTAPPTSAAPTAQTSYYTAAQPPRTPPASDGTSVVLFNGPEPGSYGQPMVQNPGIMTGHFTAPKAPATGWATIVVNYTVTSTATNGSSLYDVDYNLFLGTHNITVLFGTLPEYGTAYIQKNITEYESFLTGTVPFELRHPHDCVANESNNVDYCSFFSTLTITFYKPTTGFPAPTEPTQVIPLWNYTKLNVTRESNNSLAFLPSDTTNAVLEVYPYGYSSNVANAVTNDEFWYSAGINYPSSENPDGVFRAAYISVTPAGGGKTQGLAYVLPFPYINTGGLNIFAWRPIAGTFTLVDQPDVINVTGALGFIEGGNNFTVSLANGIAVGSYWHVTGDILIYTNPDAYTAVRDASSVLPTWTATPDNTITGNFSTVAYGFINTSTSTAFSYSSTIQEKNGSTLETASSGTTLFFNNDQFLVIERDSLTYDSINMYESTSANSSLYLGSSGAITDVLTSIFPFNMTFSDYLALGNGDLVCPTGTGSCPVAYEYEIMNGVSQTWNTTEQIWTQVLGGPSTYTYRFMNETTMVVGGNTTIIGVVYNNELYGYAYYAVAAATTQYYIQYNQLSDPNHVYTHWIGANIQLLWNWGAGPSFTSWAGQNLSQVINFNTATRSVTPQFASALQSEVAALTAEVASLEAQVASLGAKLAAEKALVSSLWNSLNDTQANLTAVQQQLATAGVKNAYLSAQLALDNSTIASLTAELQAAQQALNGYSGWVSGATAQLDMIIAAVVAGAAAGGVVFALMRRRGPPPEYEEEGEMTEGYADADGGGSPEGTEAPEATEATESAEPQSA